MVAGVQFTLAKCAVWRFICPRTLTDFVATVQLETICNAIICTLYLCTICNDDVHPSGISLRHNNAAAAAGECIPFPLLAGASAVGCSKELLPKNVPSAVVVVVVVHTPIWGGWG